MHKEKGMGVQKTLKAFYIKDSLLTRLTSLIYFNGGASLWVSEVQSNHAKDPMRSLRSMRRKADIMVGQAKYLRLAECLFPG